VHKTQNETVENIVKSLHLIAGDGPFQGDQAELIPSVERFSKTYFKVCRNAQPIDMALTTFLALAFYDSSTALDHQVLNDQMDALAARFQSWVNDRLRLYAIHTLVTPEDVDSIFHKHCVQEFRSYVEDPLCPAFKFSLTTNEELRLTNKLILRFDRLEPLFEEMAIMVKYGGTHKGLKMKVTHGISLAVQNMLSSMAFLRKPSYVGVKCQYRGRYGFSTIIPETLYQVGRRPKERFKAMQYFHLGHRLEDKVEQAK
jgi:hypothetical protein